MTSIELGSLQLLSRYYEHCNLKKSKFKIKKEPGIPFASKWYLPGMYMGLYPLMTATIENTEKDGGKE